jgi:hypothetical protein
MTNIYFQLQLISIAQHDEIIFYVGLVDSRQGIRKKQQCRCLLSSIGEELQ